MNPRMILQAKAPLRTRIRMLLFYMFFPEIFTSLVAFRDSIMMQGQALEIHNSLLKLLNERLEVLWSREVENSLYRR